ncbi:MAG: hypothetical protein IPL07_00625 [Acidimicrobiaceae bacterium]|jgi:hypothetical protein|nr:hypothetical protein [Acidimicrobiaceae bacterium]
MGIELARQLHSELLGYLSAVPDLTVSDDLDTDERLHEVERMLNVLLEVVARQTTILRQLIEHGEQTH